MHELLTHSHMQKPMHTGEWVIKEATKVAWVTDERNTPPPEEMTSSMAAISIRQFQPTDLPQVHRLFVEGLEAYPDHNQTPEESQQYVDYSLNADLADIDAAYMQTGGNFWVAVNATEQRDANIVGIVAIERISDVEGELRRMSVRSDFRRCGLGRLLVSHLEQWAQANKFSRVTLNTGVVMAEARRFYESLGYRETHRSIEQVGATDPHYELVHFLKEL